MGRVVDIDTDLWEISVNFMLIKNRMSAMQKCKYIKVNGPGLGNPKLT